MCTYVTTVIILNIISTGVELKTRRKTKPGLDVKSNCRTVAQRQKHLLPLRLLISSISRRRKEAVPGREGAVALLCW